MDTGSSKALFALCKFFVLFCKKSGCQQEAISSVNDFFHLPKFSQLSSNFKDAVERAAIFCQATLLCSLTAILFREHDRSKFLFKDLKN